MTTSTDIKSTPSLAIVVPCYNEQEAFPFCLEKLSNVLNSLIARNKINNNSYLLFVDDGSRDNTWAQIKDASTAYHYVRGIKLSRNKGHQIALMAGLRSVDTDVSISIDADLQDDVNCIEKMIDAYSQGYDIVYGVRGNRDSDTFFKRTTANAFYAIMSHLGVNQTPNHADYRLLSNRALEALKQYKEQNIYLRGLVPLVGYPSIEVQYSREERIAGESKYPIKKCLRWLSRELPHYQLHRYEL